ncbi:MAG: regulator of sirC expression with transglutaminase-like and TPR domain [Sphingobacteriales bacterium]|jgi:regulator of sirC expression with transglutaminase-like and TPR domain
MNKAKINSLIQLLDDPDERIFHQVRQALMDCGREAIPELELFWERNDFEAIFMQRVENLIHDIQFSDTIHRLKSWIKDGGGNLFDGAMIVSAYQYPDLDPITIKDKIKTLAKTIWMDMNNTFTAFEKVKIINHYFYGDFGFSGNRKNFHNPSNSFINCVLETKKGNPLSLSILYMLIAEELDEPIVGVNLPNHFVVGYLDQNNITAHLSDNPQSVLFYINCFSKGMTLQKNELFSFLEQLEIEPTSAYFEPCANMDTIRRMLINLKMAFQKIGEIQKEVEIDEMLGLFKA